VRVGLLWKAGLCGTKSVYEGGLDNLCWGRLSEKAEAKTDALDGAEGNGWLVEPNKKLNFGMSLGLDGSGGGVRELFAKLKVGLYGVEWKFGLKLMDSSARCI
jgi:hypothetical protein